MKFTITATAIAALLLGCTSSNAQQGSAEYADIIAFCNAASTGPEAAVIRGKTFVERVTEFTPEMLSDPNAPTLQEADAIKSLDARRVTCRARLVDWTVKYDPGQAPNMQEQFYKEDLALGDLIRRKTSYGDANRRIYEAYLEAVKGFNAERKAEIAAAQAEQEKRLAIIREAIANMPKVQVQPPVTMQPVQAQKTTNCSSNIVGSTVYTNCY